MWYFVLAILLVIAGIGWWTNWFMVKVLTAWMTKNYLRMPDPIELEECADLVKRQLRGKDK